MASTYTEVKTALDLISARIIANKNKRDNAKALLTAAQTDLGNIAADYSTIIADINQGALDNPADNAWLVAKAEKDQMVADFQALKAEVDALVTAVNT